MSLESLEAGSFVANPPQQETYSTMAEQASSVHYDQIDHRIVHALDGARDEIIIANRTIGAHSNILEVEVAREQARITDQAKLERIEARRERDRLMDEINQAYQKQISEIDESETESLTEIQQTSEDGKEFFAACERVGETINEAIAQYREQHASLVQTIDQVSTSLIENQTEIINLDKTRHEKIDEREELVRDHEATDRITKRNRQKRVELMRSSVDNNDELHKRRQGIEDQVAANTPDDINRAYGEYEQQEYAFQRVHSDIMARIGVLDDEIEEATLQNNHRNERITQLRYEIDALKAEAEGLRDYSEILDEYLDRLDGMKKELETTSVALQDRAEALQVIVRGGFEAIDSIPLELQEIVKTAISLKKREAAEQPQVDFTTVLPEVTHATYKIDISTSQMSSDALRVVAQARKEEAQQQQEEVVDVEEPTIHENVKRITEDVVVLREWVQQNALQLLPDAAKVIPQKITTPGMRAHVKVAGK